MLDPDPSLRRLELTAAAFCGGAALVALIVQRGTPDVAAGIVGGGLLVAASYGAIRGSVNAVLRAVGTAPPGSPPGTIAPAARRRAVAVAVLRFSTRYALLALGAYVMIARFRLHPIGLLIGVSSAVIAASVEAVRALAGPGARPHA
jgi:hypothetical protein